MIIDLNAWLGVWPFRSLRDNTPEALIRRLEKCGISMAAVSSIEAVTHRNVQPANERLAEAVAPHGDRLIPIATVNPTYVKWEDDLDRSIEGLGMRGVRLFPHYHGYAVAGPEARRVVQACRERGVPVFIPQRIEDHRQRHWLDKAADPVDLGAVAQLLKAVPGVTIVVTNARGLSTSPFLAPAYEDADWYVDISLAEVHYVLHQNAGRMREIADFIEAGGARRLVFGTHAPFSYPGAAMVKRAVLPVSEEELEEISYRRAQRLLGLA